MSLAAKDAKAALRKQTFDMWLAMHTQAEIAEAIGYSIPHVNEFIQRTMFGNGGSAISEHTLDSDDDEDSNSLGPGSS